MSTPALASGYTVTFVAAAGHGGASFSPGKLTRVTLTRSGGAAAQRQRVSIAHLGEPYTQTITVNGQSQTVRREEPHVEIWQPRASSGGGGTLELDFIGSVGLVQAGVSGSLTVSGAGLDYSGASVTCSGCQVTLATGDVIRGSASFSLPLAGSTSSSCTC